MKFLGCLFLYCIAFSGFAQIPNASFEVKDTVHIPTSIKNWLGSYIDDQRYIGGDYGVRAYPTSRNIPPFGTRPGSLISDTFTREFDKAKGFEINGRPDSLFAWLSFKLESGDTVIVRTKNRKQQSSFGYGELKITESTNARIKKFGLKIDYNGTGNADSCVIEVLVKSARFSPTIFSIFKIEMKEANGNIIPVPNSDFNDWNSDLHETIAGWTTSMAAQAIQGGYPSDTTEVITTDASNGNFALNLKTLYNFGFVVAGSAMAISPEKSRDYNGILESPQPMFPISHRYLSFSLDYKYNASNEDGLISVALFSNGNMVAKTDEILQGVNSSFTNRTFNFDYGSFKGIPDYASIFIRPAQEQFPQVWGVELVIDNMSFENISSTDFNSEESVKVYPNPVSSNFSIISNGLKINYLELSNLNGQVVKTKQSEFKSLDMSSFAPGIYFLTVYSENNSITKKIIKQ